tara:strand:- start:10914 stop:12290 length:1377 start_codon:yes stop_codon:yes gene_type:complete
LNTSRTNINQFDRAYLIGIGGIGMSAIARYFKSINWVVGGYDKTPTLLTKELEKEGIKIHYNDLKNAIPKDFQDIKKTLVIYTPAIPSSLGELIYIKNNGFVLFKRAVVLGMITKKSKSLCIAGTHGKTTIATMVTHVLNQSQYKCTAFLGGISSNIDSNFITNKDSKYTVVEADEFDRSFLHLRPFASIISSIDPDHLDIYKTINCIKKEFQNYANLIHENGFMIKHKDLKIDHPNTISYGLNFGADYFGENIRFENNTFVFDVKTPSSFWKNVILGVPGIHNAENAIACIALCSQLGLKENEIRKPLASFKGVKRRFEYHIKSKKLIYIDDYAHHPTEINALISSIKLLYPTKKITAIFQPHLFSRTKDFMTDFAEELSNVDELILLPIYPAREKPIKGITSKKLLDKITLNKKKILSPKETLEYICKNNLEVLLTIGAGDINKMVTPIKKKLINR